MRYRKKLGIFFAIALTPFLLIAMDLAWRNYTGQTADGDQPPFLHETFFDLVAYSPILAMSFFAFFAPAEESLWTRIALALLSGLFTLLWIMLCIAPYFMIWID